MCRILFLHLIIAVFIGGIHSSAAGHPVSNHSSTAKLQPASGHIPALSVQAPEQPETDAADRGIQSETDRLNEWLDEKFEQNLQMSPMHLTYLGRKDHYHRIDDMTEEAEDRRLAWRAQTVEELEQNFDYDDLEPEAQMSYDLWMYQYDIARAGAEFRELDYVFDQMRGSHTSLPQFLINFHRVDDADDMAAYISRIEGISEAIRQLLERAERYSAAKGVRPPRFAYETVLEESLALITGGPFDDHGEDSPLWEDAKNKIADLLDAEEIDAAEAESFQREVEDALTRYFHPAYRELISWLETDMEQTVENPVGVSRHPRGEEFYRHRLRVSTTTDLTARDIHKIGLAEVERITEEMREIKQQVEFDGDLDDFFTFIRTGEQFFYPDTDEGREAYLEDSRRYLEQINERLPEFFGVLPNADLVVRRVESFREQDGAPQHYMPGTPDGSRPGIYYAHLSDMSAMPKNEMEAVAYHEGNPGHHMQISIAQELEDVPQFRTQTRFTAYVEGWALYAEALAREMGGYENPYTDFGRLVAEIWRAIRLVVDTGMHAKGWTEEEAVTYFSNHSPAPQATIRAEIQRYLVMPGQATAYKIGMLEIQEMRARAESELGDRFDIREFHDTVLGGGALPLHLLNQQINSWIDDRKGE